MATRNKRGSARAGREPREEEATVRPATRATTHASATSVATPRASAKTPKATAPARGAIVALRLAVTPSGRDATPRHEPSRESPHTPAAPRKPGARKQFTELRDALASGFEIVQPVFARPLWSAADDSLTAYSFVLRRESATRLVTVPGGRLVERFIATHHLSVDERR
jgi:hypothetical protein